MSNYLPPFEITSTIIQQISLISESLGKLSILDNMTNLRLRRINRMRTIQGSLAIEGNQLNEEQVTAILEGKQIIAPMKDIQEVRNAINTYEHFTTWDFAKEKDLLKAHQTLMIGLIDDAGAYRNGNVGVIKGKKVIHMAPPANRVKKLMDDLLNWVKTSDAHPLIISSVFHYEFEYIHPFSDGNGRIGRLWQTLILSKWNAMLGNLPVESMIYKNQKQYYSAIHKSTQQTNSATFIEFMLNMILSTINSQLSIQISPQDTLHHTPQVKKLLSILSEHNKPMSRDELQQILELKDRKSFRERYLKPAIEQLLVSMTIPEKPNSRLQRYVITELGLAVSRRE
jgi:Fic family protein